MVVIRTVNMLIW